MIPLKIIFLEFLPPTHVVHLALIRNLANAPAIHAQLLARNSEYEYTFIDAGILVSEFQVLVAVGRAVAGEVAGTLKTANVHSEVLNGLNPGNNISESYSRFGMSKATTKDLLIVKIAPATAAPAIAEHLEKIIEGDFVEVNDEEISKGTDWKRVNKYYKLNGVQWLAEVEKGREREVRERLVVSAMAVKGV